MWLSDHLVTIIGIVASIGTGTSLVPQLFKLVKTKKSGDVSMWMLAVLFAGLGMWIVYGIMKKDWIIIISNAFSLAVNLTICILSYSYKGKGINKPDKLFIVD